MKKLSLITLSLLCAQQILPDHGFGSSFAGGLTGSFFGSALGNATTRDNYRPAEYYEAKTQSNKQRAISKRIKQKENDIRRLEKRIEKETNSKKIDFYHTRIKKLNDELDILHEDFVNA